MNKIFILFLTLSISFQAFSTEVEVFNWNIGLARAKFINLVPCINRRIGAMKEYFGDIVNDEDKTVVYALQEAYSRRFYKYLRSLEENSQYKVYPRSFKELKKNGILFFTNAKVENSYFIEWERTKYPGIKRGIRFIQVENESNENVFIANTHTSYSNRKKVSTVHQSNLNQITEAINNLTSNGSKVLIAGDFNIGPDYSLKKQKYDPVVEIWKPFLTTMEGIGMNRVQNFEPTWNREANFLVKKPAFFIRNFESYEGVWEENTSVIDHIFTTKDIQHLGHEVLKPVNHNENRSCKITNFFLSDHFALRAQFQM